VTGYKTNPFACLAAWAQKVAKAATGAVATPSAQQNNDVIMKVILKNRREASMDDELAKL
jgi:hypothetical protein